AISHRSCSSAISNGPSIAPMPNSMNGWNRASWSHSRPSPGHATGRRPIPHRSAPAWAEDSRLAEGARCSRDPADEIARVMLPVLGEDLPSGVEPALHIHHEDSAHASVLVEVVHHAVRMGPLPVLDGVQAGVEV